MLTPLTVDRFGGLDLWTDPQDIGARGAVDMLNTRVDRNGALRTRNGYHLYSAAATHGRLPAEFVSVNPYGTTVEGVLASQGNNPGVALNSSGNVVATSAWNVGTAAAIGTSAGVTRVYGGAMTGGTRYGYYAGGAWTAVGAVALDIRRLAVTPWDNRMASVNYADRINFSDAGAPDTFGASNFLLLRPGDGEKLTGLCAWRDLLIAGKQSRLFVFYSTSTLSDGTPVFNYRTIDAGVGPLAMEGITMAAGRDAVYFIGKDGIYATTGDVPVKISAPLDPWFNGDPMPTKSFPARVGSVASGLSRAALGCAGDYVYVSPELDSSSLTFVYHVPTQTWLAYSWAMQMCSPSPYGGANGPEAMIALATNDLHRSSAAWTDDNGSAISWSYTSGYFAPSGGRRVKARGSSVFGTGTVTLQMLTQGGRPNDVADTGGSVTLGTSPTVAEGKRRRACRGVMFAHKLSGTGPASVSRLTHRFLPPGFDS